MHTAPQFLSERKSATGHKQGSLSWYDIKGYCMRMKCKVVQITRGVSSKHQKTNSTNCIKKDCLYSQSSIFFFNLLLSIPVLLSVHQIFVQYLGLHDKTVVLVEKKKLAEIKVSVLVDYHLTIVNHSYYHRIPKNHECPIALISLSLRGRRRLRQ